jgi:predicted peptidase
VADRELPLALTVSRDGKLMELQITLADVDVAIPAKLPPAIKQGDEKTKAEVGVVDLKLAEERNECFAYVPENYRASEPHGVLIWLHAPGAFHKDKILAAWKDVCTANQLILLVPQAAKKQRWERTEVAFVRKALDELKVKYAIDPTRVVVGGHQGGGAMAYLVAFSHRDVIRGVATVDAGLPRVSRPPPADPVEALFVYTAFSRTSKSVKSVDAGVKHLKELKHPVIVIETLGTGPLSASRRAELARWIDTLDRM